MIKDRVKTLILALIYPNRASYYDDWRDAFVDHPAFDCTVGNIMTLSPRELAGKIETYDAIIALHSCNGDTLDYFAPLAPVLAERKRAKFVSFIGNEFNSPYVSMPGRVQLLRSARCDVIATQLLKEAGDYLYSASGARIESFPHALNPNVFTPGPDTRRLDIGVRGYKYPPYLGDDDRNRLLRWFAENGSRFGIDVDVGEDRRLSRSDWATYLQNCKATITTETGSWYISPDDALITQIHAFLKAKRTGLVISNDSFLRKLARHLPSSAKTVLMTALKKGPIGFEVLDDNDASFDELNEKFFRKTPRAPVYGKAISSRHFDAIGTKTCQIAFAGRFNDILEANEHYLALDQDLSNVSDVVARFKDPGERRKITDAAYAHVMDKHTYRHRAEQMLGILN